MLGPNELPDTKAGHAFHNHIDQLDLYEASHLRDLEQWLDRNNIPVLSEPGYLASFTYIAGGWTTKTPEYVLQECGVRTLTQAAQRASAGRMSDIESNVRRHDHRKGNNPWRTDDALASLPNLVINEDSVTSFGHLFRELEKHRVECEQKQSIAGARAQTFSRAMNTIQNSIDSFGPLTAFDWLEFTVRLHGQEWLCPTTIKPKYIHTGDGPYEGLQRLFGDEATEATSDCLERLEKYGRDDRELSNTELVFGLESALCMFSPAHLSEEEFNKLAENNEPQGGSPSHHC